MFLRIQKVGDISMMSRVENKTLKGSSSVSGQQNQTAEYEKMKKIKEMYEKIINSIEEGIHGIDIDGNIIIYNASYFFGLRFFLL